MPTETYEPSEITSEKVKRIVRYLKQHQPKTEALCNLDLNIYAARQHLAALERERAELLRSSSN